MRRRLWMKALEDMTLEELWHLFPIALQPYQKIWLTWYEQEKSLLTQCLPMEHVVRIAHIGSTSFGSIQAKAIIDILVEIAPWEKRMEIAAILKKRGYLCMSEDASRISFNKGYTPEGFAEKVFHLHLRQRNDHDELYFRDYMKEQEEDAQAYEQLKMKLALAYPYHRDAYTKGKTAFVKHITAIARTAYGNRYETKAYAISLHEQTKEHVRIFFTRTQEQEVRKHMYQLPTSLQEAMDIYEAQNSQTYRKTIFIADEYIGDIWCHDMADEKAVLSCCIFAKAYWGKGIGKHAVAMFLADCKKHCTLSFISAYLYADNLGSMQILEFNGFLRKQTFIKHGKPCYYYEKALHNMV